MTQLDARAEVGEVDVEKTVASLRGTDGVAVVDASELDWDVPEVRGAGWA